MTISIIIPTYNGKKRIRNVLESLAKQTYRDFETLILIDGSTDGTEEYIRSNNLGLDFGIYAQENKGRAAIRNKGAEHASGELLLFIDDDMRPEPGCVKQHLLHHKQHPQSLMSGAQMDDLKKAATSFQKYKCYLSNKWAEPLLQYKDKPLPLEKMHLTAANFSIPKNMFQQLGGFDEQLRDNEDLDLAIRAYHKGYNTYYNHDAFAWHDDFPSCRSFIKRQKEYRIYHEYVSEHKKEVFGGTTRFSKKISLVKELFYSFWKFDKLVTLADQGFFGWMPKKIQYKIYDWIVYAQLIKS